MADGTAQPSAALKSLEREYKAKVTETEAIFHKLLQLLSAKEAECENLKYDLLDQTESRRHWHKRATEAESRLSSVQHVMVLVDGNHHFFKPNLVRAGIEGAKLAIDTLVTEAKALAREQHKNDLPDHLSVIVHIFIDVGKLADDLSTTGLLPEPDQLWTFIQEAGKLEPGITISDCGSGHHAVEAKIRHFYELYLENCHCRHLFLALQGQSEYYEVLETYADDGYTKSKTSLVRPSGGLHNGYNLPFHTVDFSVVESVPQQATSFAAISPQINGTAGPPLPAQHYENTSVQTLSKSPSNPNPSEQPVPPSLPLGLHSSPPKPTNQTVENMQKPPTRVSKMPAKSHLERNGDKLEGSSSVGVVKLDTSSHSSHQSKAAEQQWENAPTNSYAPPAIAVPWGEEKILPGQCADDEPALLRRANNSYNRRQKQGGRRQDRPFNGPPPRQSPRQFEGSWDDMVQNEVSRAPTQASSPSPRPTSASTLSAAIKSNDFSSALTRQTLTKPEPSPLARPVCSPIALNQSGQRIDLKLPRETPSEHDAFRLRVGNRQLCNEHHMRNNCSDPRCIFDHEEISDGIYLALRNIARTMPCNQGAECRRHDCYLAHHCPNISKYSTCGRPSCPFAKKGLHSIVDLEIVEMIQPTEKKTQQEKEKSEQEGKGEKEEKEDLM
ncbi:uncharacterized protein Z519_05649 [Cladophialophora bantiana CBS 173.52]|uniref:C3H1-type domain-containing protein n=1 Tax=Cladophialophora bantiana (strain ATCC 10958 / CBS 173.52 / CDC B-1940 / NIH 8579) TaxID=1442370 RepID=A0A0D2HLW9_CLAB1|nr:uncharacterized protein Z519_05649 [Cladophialophora bantiana CBS 173.52]KIW94333.1 hypothetical protein Z519_05649 [Cladophialophora bantiana CBS 173.52]